MKPLSPPLNPLRSGPTVRTHTHSGNAASDWCYYNRNSNSFACGMLGWPQNDPAHNICAERNNEAGLIKCLSESGEPDWWKAFPGCTDGKQCYDMRYSIIWLTL